jgi:hypothetical protein
VAVNIDESSYNGGLGGARAMGTDHPMSWYRKLPTGGRFFYTAVGHRANIWQGGAQPRFLRRQLYNAILWTAKYDSVANVVSVQAPRGSSMKSSGFSRLAVSPSALTVTLIPGGSHSVELMTVDGKRVAFQQGEGSEKAYNFTGLRAGVYAVSVATAQGRSSRLVTIQ